MIKLLLILLVGLVFESAGVILLKKGMNVIGDMNGYTAAEIFRVMKAGATNPQILLGVFFEALFFLLPADFDVQERHQLSLAAHRVEFRVCHARRDVVSRRTRFDHPVDRASCSSCSAQRSSATANTRKKNLRRRLPRKLLSRKNNFGENVCELFRCELGFLLQLHQRGNFSGRLGDGQK